MAEQARKCFYLNFHFPINSQMLLLLSIAIIYIPLYAYQFQILNLVDMVIYSITLSLGYLLSFYDHVISSVSVQI